MKVCMFQGWLVVVIGTYNYSAISACIPRVFSGGNLLQFFGQGLYGRDGTSYCSESAYQRSFKGRVAMLVQPETSLIAREWTSQ